MIFVRRQPDGEAGAFTRYPLTLDGNAPIVAFQYFHANGKAQSRSWRAGDLACRSTEETPEDHFLFSG